MYSKLEVALPVRLFSFDLTCEYYCNKNEVWWIEENLVEIHEINVCGKVKTYVFNGLIPAFSYISHTLPNLSSFFHIRLPNNEIRVVTNNLFPKNPTECAEEKTKYRQYIDKQFPEAIKIQQNNDTFVLTELEDTEYQSSVSFVNYALIVSQPSALWTSVNLTQYFERPQRDWTVEPRIFLMSKFRRYDKGRCFEFLCHFYHGNSTVTDHPVVWIKFKHIWTNYMYNKLLEKYGWNIEIEEHLDLPTYEDEDGSDLSEIEEEEEEQGINTPKVVPPKKNKLIRDLKGEFIFPIRKMRPSLR